MYIDLQHSPNAGVCRFCGARRVVSSWYSDTYAEFFYIITCVACDAPDDDEPFAE